MPWRPQEEAGKVSELPGPGTEGDMGTPTRGQPHPPPPRSCGKFRQLGSTEKRPHVIGDFSSSPSLEEPEREVLAALKMG